MRKTGAQNQALYKKRTKLRNEGYVQIDLWLKESDVFNFLARGIGVVLNDDELRKSL